VDVHGDAGRDWLAALPETLSHAADRWALTFEELLPATYAYVAGVRTPRGEAVLKAAVPGVEAGSEHLALAHAAGRGAVRLLDADAALGLLLLERLRPGTPLVTIEDDDAATRIAAAVIRTLHGPGAAADTAAHTDAHTGVATSLDAFPSTADWARGFARHRAACRGGTGPLPTDLFEIAERRSRELHASQAEARLLHGDLHHRNVLASGDAWRAIDPKGVTGEAAYECGALLRNPWPEILEWADLDTRLDRRLAILSEMLGHPRERLAAWGVAQGVLSAIWSAEDHGEGWEGALRCAELLAPHAH